MAPSAVTAGNVVSTGCDGGVLYPAAWRQREEKQIGCERCLSCFTSIFSQQVSSTSCYSRPEQYVESEDMSEGMTLLR